MSSKIANQLQTFYSSVRKTPFCWFWTRSVDDEGYAWTDIPRRPRRAIIFLYETMHRPLAPTKRLGLVCLNRLCVNPDHIEVRGLPLDVTKLVNKKSVGRGSQAKVDPIFSFWAMVNRNGPIPLFRPELGPCWPWTGAPNNRGYGNVRINGKLMLVHRQAYLLEHGNIPDGLELDHLCRNKLCVNPKHLEAVTHVENMRRARGPRLSQTHCKNGHEFTPENTHYRFDEKTNRAWRACRECDKERWYRYFKRLFKNEDGLLVQYG